MDNPTEHFTIREPHNTSVSEFYAVTKRLSTDFKACALGNVWPGSLVIFLGQKKGDKKDRAFSRPPPALSPLFLRWLVLLIQGQSPKRTTWNIKYFC